MNNWRFIHDWFEGKRLSKKGYDRSYCNLRMDGDAVYSFGSHFPLVFECANGYLLNGAHWGPTTSHHQNVVRQAAQGMGKPVVVIPFNSLGPATGAMGGDRSWRESENVTAEAAKKVRILCAKEDSYRTVKYKDANGEEKEREEHLLGASVIRYESPVRDVEGPKDWLRFFISSTDPGSPWGRGFFLTELVRRPNSVEDAFLSLKPQNVRDAEKKGYNVRRQGEWFFIEIGDARILKKWLRRRKGQRLMFIVLEKQKFLPVQVGSSQREPHHKVTEMFTHDVGMFVRGTVRHTGHDHKMLSLGSHWWLAVHNRQKASWSVSGRVD